MDARTDKEVVDPISAARRLLEECETLVSKAIALEKIKQNVLGQYDVELSTSVATAIWGSDKPDWHRSLAKDAMREGCDVLATKLKAQATAKSLEAADLLRPPTCCDDPHGAVAATVSFGPAAPESPDGDDRSGVRLMVKQ